MPDPDNPEDVPSTSGQEFVEAHDVTAEGDAGSQATGRTLNGAPLPSDTVPSFLLPAILATLLCCFPAGIVALVYAIQVPSHLNAGNLAAAEHASQSARRWILVALALGLVVFVVFLIVQVLANM